MTREKDGCRLLFLVSHVERPTDIAVPPGRKDLLTGIATGELITLELFGVAVVKL